jgi:type IV pilus assembly protein PilW
MILNKKNKHGYTLIELMVGILISSIVAGGALKFIETAMNTDQYQKATILIQNETKYAVDYLVSDIRMAGFSLTEDLNSFEKQPFDWTNTTDGVGNLPDQIEITYENSQNNTDCNGVSNLAMISNHYYVNNGNLMCNNQTILDNIEIFEILYGIDLNNNGRVDRYLSATTARPISENSLYRVIAVRFDIISSSENGYSGVYLKSFNISNSRKLDFTDNKIYKSYTRTIMLKNMY